MSNEDSLKWVGHNPMSDPAAYAHLVAGLPSDISGLNSVIQGLLVHSGWLTEYGLDETQLHADSRKTLPVADRLADILTKDARPLQTPRPPGKRAIGTCRDFALMLCSLLRCKGIPSRVRCGFANYFGSGWEDHWVCEYWDGSAGMWRLSDAQIDQILRRRLCIAFDPSDVPRQSFISAGQAWLECRAGTADPDRFGHGEVTGLWFVSVNVVRDHYVLNGRETSAWDSWRAASPSARVVSRRDAALLDDVATFPERRLVEVAPDWLA
jgi:hypothetical protein